MAPFWEDFGRPGGVWAPLGPSWRVLGASWGRLGASWGHLGASWRLWGASWRRLGPQNPPKRNLTRHGTGSAVLFKGSFMKKPCGTTLDHKASSRSRTLRSLRSLRSLARCARPAGFHWGFAGVLLGFRWRSWIANLPNALQIFRKILGKSSSIPPKIHPKTFQNRPLNLKKSRSGRGCDLDCVFVSFCAPPGGVLGPSWGVLGASWGRLGAALGRLGGVFGRLGTVLGRLGTVLGRFGPRRDFESDF